MTRSSYYGAEPPTRDFRLGRGGGGDSRPLGQRSLSPAAELRSRGDPRLPESRSRLLPGLVSVSNRAQICTHLGSSTTGAVPPPPPSTVTASRALALPGSNGDSAGPDRKRRSGPTPGANRPREAGLGATPPV